MWMLLIGFPMFWECSQEDSSWEDNYCVEGIKTWPDASKNYTVPYCVSKNVDYAYDYNITSLNNSLSFELGEKSTKDMIVQYCTALLGDQNHWRIYYSSPNSDGNRDWRQTFDSRQSVFVYALCSSFKTKGSQLVTLDSALSDIFKWEVAKSLKLQQKEDWKDQCDVNTGNLDDCDMSIYAAEIFSAIMSDVFKIKYAQIFHVDSVETFQKDKKKRMVDFLSWYFNMTDEKKIKDFPDTVDVINSNQQHYKSALKNLRLLDNSKLAKMAVESGCPITWDVVWNDFVACALHSSQWNWSSLSPEFPTFFYNELLAYRIFVEYYSKWVSKKVESLTKIEDKEKWNQKSDDLKYYAGLQIEAATQTLHNFEELNMTYPLHIWFLLYQEKLREFRNKYLPHVVKQFYSLSEKLQNVQLPD